MHEYSEYFLSTGEFAKLCDTTKDTLRHYHDMGLLAPQKNKENGYYYYSLSQITSFYFINMFRQLDTPLKSIKTYITAKDNNCYYDFCMGQLDNLYRMREDIDNKIAALSNTTKLMHHMSQSADGVPHIITLSERTTYFVTSIVSEHSGKASDIIEDIRRHIKRCNDLSSVHTFPIGATIDYSDFSNGIYHYRQLCSSTTSAEISKDIQQLPTRKVIGCSCNESTTDIKNIYRNMFQFIKSNNITVLSDLFSISLFNFMDTNAEHRYLKYLFICIDE